MRAEREKIKSRTEKPETPDPGRRVAAGPKRDLVRPEETPE